MKITIETEENQPNELEKQLHEQYAINNNAVLGGIITLACTLIVVIGYYGYVFVNSSVEFSTGFCCLRDEDGIFYLDALLCSYVISFFILFVLSRFCIYQGIAQRKEQFITFAIRKKYNMDNDDAKQNTTIKVLPKDYHPFGKNKREAVQGLYGELLAVFNCVFWLLTIGILIKLISNVVEYDSFYLLGLVEYVICIIVTILLLIVLKRYLNNQMYSYICRQKEYNVINPIENLKTLLVKENLESNPKKEKLREVIKSYCDNLK